MIGDRMISDVINAELVVADLTDLNPNAFYELGIRHAKEGPTIHIARLGTILPNERWAGLRASPRIERRVIRTSQRNRQEK
jgi:hypothetical protein